MQLRNSNQDRKWDELSQLLQGPEMRHAEGSQRKLIIVTEHKDMLHYLEPADPQFTRLRRGCGAIHGSVNRDDRRKIQELFRNDKRVCVLLATDAAGEGVNLQNANRMVNYDLPWNPNRIEQRFGRIHRIGQTQVCHLWNMLAQDTREGDVFHRLFQKLEVEREALGGRVFDILGQVFEEKSLKDLPATTARWATAAFFFMSGAVIGSWVPYIPGRAHALGLNPAGLGTVLLASGFGAVIAMPVSSRLITRLGSRRVCALSGPAFPLALALAVLAPNITTILIALALFGFSGAAMDIAMNAQAVLVEEKLGIRTISGFHGLYSLGGVVGALTTSAALARQVAPRTLILATAVALFITALIAQRFMLPKQAEHPRPSAPKSRVLRPAGKLLLLGALAFAAMISEGAVTDWSAIFLSTIHKAGPGTAGLGFAGFSAAMLLGRFAGDSLTGRIGEDWAFRLGGLLGLLGGLLARFAPTASLSLVGFVLLGLGLANAAPILYRAAGKVPGVPSGTGIATAVGIGYAGLLIGPPILGFAGQAAGIGAIFIIVAALSGLLAAKASTIQQGHKGVAAGFSPR